MGTKLASEIIEAVEELAQDPSNITWTSAQILKWANEAQLTITSFKPNAKTITRAILLATGTTKQTIAGRKLLSVIRNMGTDGSTPGKAIRLVDRGMKDEMEPDWHTETASAVIYEYILDDRVDEDDDKTWFCSPPTHGSTAVYVEVMEAIDPTDLETDIDVNDDPIDISDRYFPVIIEWCMYRIFGRDSERTPNHMRALSYLQNFYDLLGVTVKVDMALSAKLREQLK